MTATATPAAPGGYDQLLSVEAALARLLAAVGGRIGVERVTPGDALGRVVAEPVVAATSLPPWDNSAMDGYAILAADTATATQASPARIRVVGEVRAGVSGEVTVTSGAAIRIATGAPLPPGADAVVPVELTTPLGPDGTAGPRGREAAGPLPAAVLVHGVVPAGDSIRPVGGDLRRGQTIVEPGRVVTPPAVALIAGAGVEEVAVHRRPRVAVMATGDEVRAAGEPLGDAGIPDANGPGLIAQVIAAAAEPVDLGIGRDVLDDVLTRLRRALDEGADAIVVSGGVSVGPWDVVRLAFAELGRMDLWRVAVQPGKPFAFGTAARGDGGTALLFGLPGNPVSSLVTFELFVRPALRRLAGHTLLTRPLDRAVLLDGAGKSQGRRAYLRVGVERDAEGRAVRDERGRLRARLAGGQGSHVLSTLAATAALVAIPEAAAAPEPGMEVELMWLDPIA